MCLTALNCGFMTANDIVCRTSLNIPLRETGFLELELADWKWNRKYRILAVDHDMLSYADADFGEWPIVIVTNPKRAREMMPLHEPISRISKSTHIRCGTLVPKPCMFGLADENC